MEPEFADLVPLFVEEARDRIDHLAGVVPLLGRDPDAVVVARRELHTLKGSARMLALGGFAELCHAAEDALGGGDRRLGELLTRTCDGLAEMLGRVTGGEDPAADPALLAALREAGAVASPDAGAEAAAENPQAAEGGDEDRAETATPAASLAAADFRVDAVSLDRVADRATQLRLMSLAGGRVADRVHELAQLAEDGVREPQPDQVLAVLSAMLRRLAVEVEVDQRLMLRAADEQLDQILSLQLQPLRGLLLSIARVARQLAASLGKEVEVVLEGEETRLDRRISRDLEESLVHLVRNAVDHGLESPEERRRAGKPPAGRLSLTATASGSRVRLAIEDDGPGVDRAAVLRGAIEGGLVERAVAQTLTDGEIHRLLFAPGFTTRREVSEISGRGVGLDIVAAAVARVGGDVSIAGRPEGGTRVEIEVPTARRGEQVLVLKVGEARLAVPSSVIRSVADLPPSSVVEREGRSLARREGRLVPFLPLAHHFGEVAAQTQLLLEGAAAGQAIAVAVDDVLGEEEVLLRPVPRRAAGEELLEGVALLASGHPVGVLSPVALGRRDLLAHRPSRAAAAAPPRRRVQVLLVDDSLVTREMERRLLEDAGFAVTVAADADEALSRLGEGAYDCMVTDIEMPGMDGFQLTERLRSMEHFADLPIVVVSTRDRPEDRLRGLTAGADAYLTKQGLNAGELVEQVRRLAGR